MKVARLTYLPWHWFLSWRGRPGPRLPQTQRGGADGERGPAAPAAETCWMFDRLIGRREETRS